MNIKLEVKRGKEFLNTELEKEILSILLKEPLYWNDVDSYYWMFDIKLKNNYWLENIRLNNELTKITLTITKIEELKLKILEKIK